MVEEVVALVIRENVIEVVGGWRLGENVIFLDIYGKRREKRQRLVVSRLVGCGPDQPTDEREPMSNARCAARRIAEWRRNIV